MVWVDGWNLPWGWWSTSSRNSMESRVYARFVVTAPVRIGSYRIERLLELGQQAIERCGLQQVAREAIEDESGARVGLGEALADHAEHQ